MLGERGEGQGGRFEFTEIGDPEASILRRLIRSHLAGTHLTLEQLAAKEDPQTVRERVKKTVRPPNPAPSLLRFGGTLARSEEHPSELKSLMSLLVDVVCLKTQMIRHNDNSDLHIDKFTRIISHFVKS